MTFRALCLAIGLMAGAAGAQAQMVARCEGSPIAPLLGTLSEDAFVSYADGAIRLFDVYVDHNLPSSVLIGVLHPRPSELADTPHYTGCSAVYSTRGGVGYFGQVWLRRAEARYDAGRGLILRIPVRYDYADRASVEGALMLTINQASGGIEAVESDLP